MLPEDIRRLERKADLARAKRGPDYTQVERSIANAKRAAREAQYWQSLKTAQWHAFLASERARCEAYGRASEAKLEASRHETTRHVHRQRARMPTR